MFSNLYYLSTLIDRSYSLTPFEKQDLFNYIKEHEVNLLKLIDFFEKEQKKVSSIEEDYYKNLKKIIY